MKHDQQQGIVRDVPLSSMPVESKPLSSGESGVRSISILGSEIHIVEIPDVIAAIDRWIETEPGRFHYIVNTGKHGLMEGHRDSGFK